ncbi:hypothetical protein ABT404_17680 [Streptomyces hyaluromycini]|uniref:Transposase n=1 Tax=Streptomyces hyaluromycini TaxID=1377993 RepID=A0ABV1WWW5_9ACTN
MSARGPRRAVTDPEVLSAASWSADALLSEVRADVAEHVGNPAATLVLDDTQVQKKGDQVG